jgi:flavin-binding protein dodecin
VPTTSPCARNTSRAKNFSAGLPKRTRQRRVLPRALTGNARRLFVVFDHFLGNNGRMADHIYKKIELVGSSSNGFEEAVKNALGRAERTVRNMRWFEVAETRGYIEDGKIGHWQVTLKIGFTLDE